MVEKLLQDLEESIKSRFEPVNQSEVVKESEPDA